MLLNNYYYFICIITIISWVATEKIHGTNFSFITNGADIKCARRNAILTKYDEFFNYQYILEQYKTKVFSLYSEMNSRNLIKGEMIIIYGELFGGIYPHPDVSRQNLRPIQFGVYYSPKYEFMAFDLFDGEDFLDFDVSQELAMIAKIPFTKPLIRGTYEEVAKYNSSFNSTIHSLLGYPEIPKTEQTQGNLAEGIVIKPVKNLRTSNGIRVIFKIRTQNFSERKKNPFKIAKHKAKTDPIKSGKHVTKDLLEFINVNRLTSILSKGDCKISLENSLEIAALLYDDAFKAYCRDENLKRKYDVLNMKAKKNVMKYGTINARNVVQDYFTNVLKLF